MPDTNERERMLSDVFLQIEEEGAKVGIVDGVLRGVDASPALVAALRARKAEVVAALADGYDVATARLWRSVRALARDPECGCGCFGGHGSRCLCQVCCDIDPAWRRLRVRGYGEVAPVAPSV
jgi:hypothetical protein